MNSFVYYVVSAACSTGSCPQQPVIVAPVHPVPVVVYQAAPQPVAQWLPVQSRVWLVR